MAAYKRQKDAEAKVWQERTNASAWLQGIYIARAIGACLPGRGSYPDHPLQLFNTCEQKAAEKTLPDESEQRKAKANQDMITAQVIHAQTVLKRQK